MYKQTFNMIELLVLKIWGIHALGIVYYSALYTLLIFNNTALKNNIQRSVLLVKTIKYLY